VVFSCRIAIVLWSDDTRIRWARRKAARLSLPPSFAAWGPIVAAGQRLGECGGLGIFASCRVSWRRAASSSSVSSASGRCGPGSMNLWWMARRAFSRRGEFWVVSGWRIAASYCSFHSIAMGRGALRLPEPGSAGTWCPAVQISSALPLGSGTGIAVCDAISLRLWLKLPGANRICHGVRSSHDADHVFPRCAIVCH
jgi:hypothetical protein